MDRTLWALFGPTGSGKTWLWKHYLDRLPTPRLVLDRRDDLTDLGVTVTSAEHWRRAVIAVASGEIRPPVNDCYVMEWTSKRNGAALWELVRSAKARGCYVADEVQHWYGQRSRNDHLHELLMEGRKDGQSLIATSRRPQNVAQDLLNEAVLTSFRMQGKHAADRVADHFPRHVGRAEVRSLGEYEFITVGRLQMLPFDLPETEGEAVPVCRLDPEAGELNHVNTLTP